MSFKKTKYDIKRIILYGVTCPNCIVSSADYTHSVNVGNWTQCWFGCKRCNHKFMLVFKSIKLVGVDLNVSKR